MTKDDIIVQLMHTLMYARSTLVAAHLQISFVAPMSNEQKSTEWAIRTIDNTMLKIQDDLLPEQKLLLQ